MFISASRRTDIPAYYSDWFINRIKEGFVLVRNPMNHKMVSRINLSADVVDGIVFWTKNPAPMIDKLEAIKEYPYYFQFTLTPYGKDVEENLPPKNELIDTFKNLSDKIGPNRVIWRYDPILVNDKYSIDYHIETFNRMSSKLSGYTNRCVLSFMDYYISIKSNIKELKLKPITEKDMHYLAKEFSKTAGKYGFIIDTCAEAIDLGQYGIGHSKCIDDAIFSELTGYSYCVGKDKNQRLACGCVLSIDIGKYNTCLNGCRYCYANHSSKAVKTNYANYNPYSPLLCSELRDGDEIIERQVKSFRNRQIEFDI